MTTRGSTRGRRFNQGLQQVDCRLLLLHHGAYIGKVYLRGVARPFRCARGEFALGALTGLFWIPGRFESASEAAPLPRAFTQVPWGDGGARVHNGQLARWRSLLTTPSPKPHGPRSAGVCAEGPVGQSGLASRVATAWRLQFVPTPE